MKWYNELNRKYIKKNKKRTILSIAGITISVILITTILTLLENYKQIEIQNAIDKNGYKHATLVNIGSEYAEYIQKDNRVNKSGVSIIFDEFTLIDGGETKKVDMYDTNMLSMSALEMSEGNYPKKSDEIIVSEDIKYAVNEELKIGDLLELNMTNNGKVKFKIVGFIKTKNNDGLKCISYLNDSIEIKDKRCNLAVYYNKNVDVDSVTKELAKRSGIDIDNYSDSIIFNNSLLVAEGRGYNKESRNAINSIIIIVITLIILITVAIIYNIFSISIVERKKHFGILSSLGATDKQIKLMIYNEVLFMGFIGIILGLIISFLGLNSIIRFIMNLSNSKIFRETNVQINFDIKIILLVIGISLVTIVLSALLPAIKASRITPIECIRENTNIKVTKSSNKKFIGKLFGAEWDLAYKNIRRYKVRYHVTIFSLSISIILFLTMYGYTVLSTKVNSMYTSDEIINSDFDITDNSGYMFKDSEVDDYKDIPVELVDEIKKIPSVDNVTNHKRLHVDMLIEESKFNEKIPLELRKELSDGYGIVATVDSLGDDELLNIKLREGNFDIEKANKENGVILVNINNFSYNDKYIQTSLTNLKVGDKIKVRVPYSEAENQSEEVEAVILGIADKLPIGINSDGKYKFNLITTRGVQEVLNVNDMMSRQNTISIKSNYIDDTRVSLKNIVANNNIKHGLKMFINDNEANEEKSRNKQRMFYTFIYSLISLISIVAILNIINIIVTSFTLRKREFAMIQSMGMTSGGFRKMMYIEGMYCIVKSLIYSVPISILLNLKVYKSLSKIVEFEFIFPYWSIFVVATILVIIILIITNGYIRKLNKENIVESIRNENI